MKDNSNILPFSIFGGPLQQLGQRLGLVREGTNSFWLGMLLGPGTWLILLLLSLIDGSLSNFFSINVLAGHVRLLVAVPLFFLCETWIAPQMNAFVDYVIKSGLVTEGKKPELSLIILRINRLKNFWFVEVFLFLLMFLVANTSILSDNSTSADFIMKQAGGHFNAVNVFYIWFCLPLFRFLIARWIWHLMIWWYFLYRLKKLNLRLMPTHSDGAGGLGYLEVVQEYFMPLAAAFGAILSASIAEQVIVGSLAFEALYYLVPLSILISLVLFTGPMLFFFTGLRACREDGLKNYMTMAAHYAMAFDRKWITNKNLTAEEQLGNADIQSLADLTTSVRVIKEMRTVAVSHRLILAISLCVLLPFLPCSFLKFNIRELMTLLFKLLAGG